MFGYPPETEAVRKRLKELVQDWQENTNGGHITLLSYPNNDEGLEQIKCLLQLIGYGGEPEKIRDKFVEFEKVFTNCKRSIRRFRYLLRIPVMGVIGERVSIFADRQVALELTLGGFHKSFRSITITNRRVRELIKNIDFKVGRD